MKKELNYLSHDIEFKIALVVNKMEIRNYLIRKLKQEKIHRFGLIQGMPNDKNKETYRYT